MDFLELAKERYSVRKFKDTPIEQEKLDRIIEAGMIAPTARNNQPQRVYVIRSEEGMKKINECSPCIYGAPCVLLICYDNINGKADDPVACEKEFHYRSRFGEHDAAIVATHMMLEAWDEGIGSCMVGFFDLDKVRAAFDLPKDEFPMLLLPIGYADMGPGPRHTESKPREEIVKEV